jgi:hypothetical protein
VKSSVLLWACLRFSAGCPRFPPGRFLNFPATVIRALNALLSSKDGTPIIIEELETNCQRRKDTNEPSIRLMQITATVAIIKSTTECGVKRGYVKNLWSRFRSVLAVTVSVIASSKNNFRRKGWRQLRPYQKGKDVLRQERALGANTDSTLHSSVE